MKDLTCDYLILGAGAQGLAFTDLLLAQKPDCRVIIVDSRSTPGGQWNDTYEFARLDQPSIFFGVPSQFFEKAEPNCTGKLAEHTSRDQVLSYFSHVMTYFTKRKNVQYFPNCIAEIVGTGLGSSTVRLTPCCQLDKVTRARDVTVFQKIVYSPLATIQASLPSFVFPFQIDSGVQIVRPHELTSNGVAQKPMYVVIGSGKTGIDTVLWLLSHQIPPKTVHWVMPHDSWFRSSESQEPFLDWMLKSIELAATASSIEDLHLTCEQAGLICRIDEQCFPTTLPPLSLSKKDLASLRKVHNIIRLGHVRKITAERLELDDGFATICEGALCIDCTRQQKTCAQKVVPAFSKCQITLQPVAEVWYGAGELNLSFSAAFIGLLEGLHSGDEEKKNSLCTPINIGKDFSTHFKGLTVNLQGNNKIWEDKSIATFFMTRPSRFSAFPSQDINKFKMIEALNESARENCVKILHKYAIQTQKDAGDPIY